MPFFLKTLCYSFIGGIVGYLIASDFADFSKEPMNFIHKGDAPAELVLAEKKFIEKTTAMIIACHLPVDFSVHYIAQNKRRTVSDLNDASEEMIKTAAYCQKNTNFSFYDPEAETEIDNDTYRFFKACHETGGLIRYRNDDFICVHPKTNQKIRA